jgi:integrase
LLSSSWARPASERAIAQRAGAEAAPPEKDEEQRDRERLLREQLEKARQEAAAARDEAQELRRRAEAERKRAEDAVRALQEQLEAARRDAEKARYSLSAVDLDAGWVNFPRPKTGIERRAPLWPETIAALRAAIAVRPAPRDRTDAGLVFLMRTGRRWVRDTENSRMNGVSIAFCALLRRCQLYRAGLSFYALR